MSRRSTRRGARWSGTAILFAAVGVSSKVAVGFNPSWPARDPSTPPAELARPELQPDDPEYAPWARGEACRGQLPWYGFAPPCARELLPEEQVAGVGAAVDRAWLHTLGRPEVTIAVVGEGIDIDDPDLFTRIRLNPGELPTLPGVPLDRDGDGAVTVLDFTSATATDTPTVDRVVDPRLLARDDRGDVDGDGLLEPSDVLRVFSNDLDDDGDGWVDDIAGWDFLDQDNEPSAPDEKSFSTETARAAAARANDGVGFAGACPRCTLLPLRVGARGVASNAQVGFALLYAAQRARVAVIDVAVAGPTPFLSAAVAAAGARGLLTVVSAGTDEHPSLVEDLPLEDPAALLVSRVGFVAAPELALRATEPLPCAKGALHLDLVVSGDRCGNRAFAGLVAGVAGLVIAAAEGSEQGPPSARLSPAVLASVLRASARPLPSGGTRSPRTGLGRLDARAAVDLVRSDRRPAVVRWRSPQHRQVIDPTPGSLVASFEVLGPRRSSLTWTLALGRGVSPPAFEPVASGELRPEDDGEVAVDISVAGLLEDPARPPASLSDGLFVLRASARLALDPEAPSAHADRIFFLGTDLDLLPGFPLGLGSGALGGPRIVDVDADGIPEVWVALLDGRILAIDRAGRVLREVPPRTPRLSSHLIGLLGSLGAPGVARFSAPSFRASGGAWVLGSVGADAVLTRLDRMDARDIGAPVPENADRPLGFIAPALAYRNPADGAERFAWPGPEGIRRESGSELEVAVALEAAPGPLALDFGDENPRLFARSGDDLVASDGTRAPLPEPPLSFRGLAALFPEAPIVGDLERFGPSVAVPGRDTLWIFAGGTWRAADPGQATPASGALSAEERRALGWFRPQGVEGAAAEPRAVPPAPRTVRVGGLDPTLAEVVVGDVDGGAEEWVFGGDAARLFALSENGIQASGWPKLTGSPVMGAPAFGDLDLDGRVELAAVTRDGFLFVWRTRGTLERVRWSGERHDLRATANTSAEIGSGLPPGEDEGCECVCSMRREAPSPVDTGVLGLLALALRIRRGRRAVRNPRPPGRPRP